MSVIQVHINVQKCDLGGVSVPSELDRIMTIETFRQLGKGVRTNGPEEGDVIYKPQPDAGLIKSEKKKVLFKESHEKFCIRRSHAGAHGHP